MISIIFTLIAVTIINALSYYFNWRLNNRMMKTRQDMIDACKAFIDAHQQAMNGIMPDANRGVMAQAPSPSGTGDYAVVDSNYVYRTGSGTMIPISSRDIVTVNYGYMDDASSELTNSIQETTT